MSAALIASEKVRSMRFLQRNQTSVKILILQLHNGETSASGSYLETCNQEEENDLKRNQR